MSIPLYEQLYQYILDEVRSGKLKSGDRVASEKELAEQFHVSRITSKKALESLVQAQVVERIRGKGTFVMKRLPDLQNLSSLSRPNVVMDGEAPQEEQLLVGVVLEDFSASFGLRLLQAIEERCSQLKIFMLMKRSNGSREEEEHAIDMCIQIGVDALIIFPVHGDYYSQRLLKLVVDEFPLVLVDRYLKGVAAHSVYTDNRKAAFELTSYLINRGHRNIAFISSALENTSSIDDRFQGFSAALVEHGIPFNSSYCLTRLRNTLLAKSSEDALRFNENELSNFIESHRQLTAFVACEYNMALHVNQTLLSTHQNASDYEVVCFDYPEVLFEKPQFTHILQDEKIMGQLAVNILFSRLQGQAAPLQTLVPYHLIDLNTREEM